MHTKMDVWVEVLKTKIPDITYGEAFRLSSKAASDWYSGSDTVLADLFDKFIMLKQLRGIHDEVKTGN